MRTSYNIPDDLLAEFGETWQAEGLDSQSRAVREAMYEYIEAHADLDSLSGHVTAAVAFDYEQELVIRELHDVHHQFQDVIRRTNHTRRGLVFRNCLLPWRSKARPQARLSSPQFRWRRTGESVAPSWVDHLEAVCGVVLFVD